MTTTRIISLAATVACAAIRLSAADAAAQPQPVMSAMADGSLKVAISALFQARAEWSQAQDGDGLPYDVSKGADGAKSADADFYMRRVRLFLLGSYGDYSFRLGLRADNADRKGNDASTASSQRGFEINFASFARSFKSGRATHVVQAGLDYAFFNSASFGNGAAQLAAADRASAQLLAPRGTGVGYRLGAPLVSFGADVQNNTKVLDGNGDTAAASGSAGYQAEGLCYTARIELTPDGEWAIKPKDFKESFAGQSGHGAVLALETGYNQHDLGDPSGAERGRWRDTWLVGTEALVHFDGLSALAEYRWARQTTNSDMGEVGNVDGGLFLAQAGYAFLPPGFWNIAVEPIARYTRMDLNRGTEESGLFGSSDYATSSGNQYEVGANAYLGGVGNYSNKVSVLYTHWEAESSSSSPGSSVPRADIVRMQYQFVF